MNITATEPEQRGQRASPGCTALAPQYNQEGQAKSKMQTLWPRPRVWAQNLHMNKIPRWVKCLLKFGKCRSRGCRLPRWGSRRACLHHHNTAAGYGWSLKTEETVKASPEPFLGGRESYPGGLPNMWRERRGKGQANLLGYFREELADVRSRKADQ